MLKINLLTGKTNMDAESLVGVSPPIFWRYYLKLLNIEQNIFTDREIDFVAEFINNSDPKHLQQELKMSAPNYYGMLKKLQTKGIITIDNQLHPNIKKFDYRDWETN